MSSLRRLILTIALLCTLTVSMVAASGTTYAQTTSHQTAHAQQTAMHLTEPDMGIQSYWDGTLVTLNNKDMQVLAAGSVAIFWVISAIPGAGKLLGIITSSITTFNATNAYIHNQCYWFWVSTYKPDYGTYPCH